MKEFFNYVFNPEMEEQGESIAAKTIKDLKAKLSLRTNETIPIIKASAIIEFLRIYKDLPKERFISDWWLNNQDVIYKGQYDHIVNFMAFENDYSAANLMSMLDADQQINFIDYTLNYNNDEKCKG